MDTTQYKKRNIKEYLFLYLYTISQDLKGKMSYRTDFWISIIASILFNVAEVIAFWILFQSFKEINGYSFYDIMFIFGFLLVSLAPEQIFFNNNWNLRGYIFSGEFIKYCLRPINIYIYFMSETIGISGIGQLVFGIFILAYASCKLKLTISFGFVVLLVCNLCFAALIMISLMTFAASVSFFVNGGSVYSMVFAYKFKDYAKYPMTIYNKVFRFVFSFIIPIGYIAFYPSQFFLNKSQIPMFSYFTPIIGGLFFYSSYKLWMKGAMKYSGTGS